MRGPSLRRKGASRQRILTVRADDDIPLSDSSLGVAGMDQYDQAGAFSSQPYVFVHLHCLMGYIVYGKFC
jgi:hypothetical protein